jgi:hypothetical protein
MEHIKYKKPKQAEGFSNIRFKLKQKKFPLAFITILLVDTFFGCKHK